MHARWLRHAATLPAVVSGAWYGSEQGSRGRLSSRARGHALAARLELPCLAPPPHRGRESPGRASREPRGAGGRESCMGKGAGGSAGLKRDTDLAGDARLATSVAPSTSTALRLLNCASSLKRDHSRICPENPLLDPPFQEFFPVLFVHDAAWMFGLEVAKQLAL